MDSDYELKMSPLCCTVESDGQSVRVEIYEGDEGGWILEVVDKFGNSTIGENTFPSDQDALNEARKAVEEDGIGSLIGPPAGQEWVEEKEPPR